MYRWTTLVLGLLLSAALTLILLDIPDASVSAEPRAVEHTPPDASTPGAPSDALADAGAAPSDDLDEALAENAPAPIGTLSANAPKSVTFGVVLFRYRGAEAAPSDARSKAEAKALADALLPQAEQDFAAAVQRGDRGSTTNAGRMPQGVLEPALEYAVFSLKPGQLQPQPVDSPRGYWLVKRLK